MADGRVLEVLRFVRDTEAGQHTYPMLCNRFTRWDGKQALAHACTGAFLDRHGDSMDLTAKGKQALIDFARSELRKMLVVKPASRVHDILEVMWMLLEEFPDDFRPAFREIYENSIPDEWLDDSP